MDGAIRCFSLTLERKEQHKITCGQMIEKSVSALRPCSHIFKKIKTKTFKNGAERAYAPAL
jgi:hypothetical protein